MRASDSRSGTNGGLGGARVVLPVAVVVLLLQVTLLWIGHRPEPRRLFGDEIMYWQGATLLAEGEPWRSEPLWPPLQFHLLGRIHALTSGSRLAVEILQLAMLVGVAALLRALTRSLTDSDLAADVAAALVLVYPPLVASAHYLWPETLHLLLMLGALWILVERGRRWQWLAAAGVLLGLALSTKSLLAPFLPVLLLPLALEGTRRQRLVRPAVVVAAALVTVLPTALRTGEEPGSALSGSATFNLWVGINDRSAVSLVDPIAPREYRAYLESGATAGERNRATWERIGARWREQGTAAILKAQLARQYVRLFDRDSFLTVQLPGGSVAASGRGYVRPPDSVATLLRASSYGLYALILVGSAIGVGVLPHRGRRWLLVALAFVAYNLAIFLLLHVKSRYRLQMMPILMLYTGAAVAWIGARWGATGTLSEWRQRVPPWAWLLAGGLLILAFGGRTLDG